MEDTKILFDLSQDIRKRAQEEGIHFSFFAGTYKKSNGKKANGLGVFEGESQTFLMNLNVEDTNKSFEEIYSELVRLRNKLNRQISTLKKAKPEEEEIKSFTKQELEEYMKKQEEKETDVVTVSCQYCGDEEEVDLNNGTLDYDKIYEIRYWLMKANLGRLDCKACSRAIKGWQLRTGTCHYCTKLARYTGDERFVECFGCGRKA